VVGNLPKVIYEPAPDGVNSLGKPTTLSLTAEVRLNNGLLDGRAKWRSKNTLVATVDSVGLVKAVGRGTTEIIAIPADDLAYPAELTVPSATAVIEVQAVGGLELVVQ